MDQEQGWQLSPSRMGRLDLLLGFSSPAQAGGVSPGRGEDLVSGAFNSQD